MADTAPDSFRRTRIDASELPPGAVLVDQTRERTSWAEGMFVTAGHFNRDQSYVIARQGDLGQAIGAGVVAGLEVRQPADNPTAVTVAPGLGIGGGGESIVLHAPVTISLADVSLQKSLTKSAGLSGSLGLISENRTGLFILCATPVEYTSNPVGSYATTPDGQRTLRDSVVNEATLFTLVPFTLSTTAQTPQTRRAVAARRVFLDRAFPAIPPSSLPLAMLELDGNVLVWLDMHLARRQAGTARSDVFGIGLVDTPTRAAHSAQYETVIGAMVGAAPEIGFAAADRFDILPPMGRMPTASVAPRAPAPGLAPVLSHNWLPAEMPVELTALPEDEIEQLLEESLSMPPIDLRAPAAALRQTPVTIIVPIPRADWADAPLEVVQQSLSLQPAAPLGATPKTPMELIKSLLEQDADPDLVDPTDDAAWLALLSGTQTLWYMRRRQFLRTDALTGQAYAFANLPPADDDENGGGGPMPQPQPQPQPDLALARAIADTFHRSVSAMLDRLGLSPHVAAIRSANDAAGLAARAEIMAAIATVAQTGAEVVLTDLVRRAEASGALTAEEARRLARSYETDTLATRFVPFEGLLTGGSVDLVIPQFAEPGPASVRPQFARSLNGGTAPIEAPTLPVPNDMPARVRTFLREINTPDPITEGILSRGGGTVPMRNARDIDQRIEVLTRSLDLGVPLVARLRAPGSVEAQTRRNLLMRTEGVARLTAVFAAHGRDTLFKPLVQHMQIMERALEQAPADAIRLVTESVTQIMEA